MAIAPKATNIPDAHHVVRHCKHRMLLRRRESGRPYGVFPEHFHLRPASTTRQQERYLSSIYYETFPGTALDKMRACSKAIPFVPNKKDAMVRLNVRSTKAQGAKRSIKLRVMHEPKKVSPSYSAIRGLPIKPDHELCGLLATMAVVEIVEVSVL